MNERESTSELAVRFWRRMPFAFALAITLSFLGLDALLSDVGLWERADRATRYIGALSGGLAAYWIAADWRRDARERARREIDRAEA